MKLLGIVLALLLIAGGLFAFVDRKMVTYRDQNVVAGEVTSPVAALFPHLSKSRFISIFGRTYNGVTGSPPYYIDMPAIHSVLFVTRNDAQTKTFHIVNIQTKKEVHISANRSSFGGNIGSGRKDGRPLTDFVESETDKSIRLVTQSLSWKEIIVLNLESETIEKMVTTQEEAAREQ